MPMCHLFIVFFLFFSTEFVFSNSSYRQLQHAEYNGTDDIAQNAKLNLVPADMLKIIHDLLPKKDQKNYVLVAQKIADAVRLLSRFASVNVVPQPSEQKLFVEMLRGYPRLRVQIRDPDTKGRQIQLLSQLSNLTDLRTKDAVLPKQVFDLCIKAWSNLNSLSLQDAWLHDEKSLQCLSDLHHLSHLDLANSTHVSFKSCELLSSLTGLKSLDVSNCLRYIQAGLQSLSSLQQLQTLNLSYSEASNLRYLSCFKNLTNLCICHVTAGIGAELPEDELGFISYLTNLRILEMFNSGKIASICLKYLTALSGLNSLRAGCCHIPLEMLPCLSVLTKLHELDISNCQQNGTEGLQYLTDLTSLKTIKLAYCWSGLYNLSYFSCLTNLTRLDLSHNKLCNVETLQCLSDLKTLKCLDLSYCNGLTVENVKHLSLWTNMKDLRFGNAFY